jgi:hypothetical protein
MDTRVQLLKDWMAREERGTVWVAKKVGRTKAYMSHILHGRLPLTEKLARDIRAKLGIPLPEPGQEAQCEDMPSHPDHRGQRDALSS